MKTLLDNHHQKLVDYLREHLGDCDAFRLVSAYFSIYGYGALADKLNAPKKTRFLLGEPSLIDSSADDDKPVLLAQLQEEGLSFAPSHIWEQQELARRCADWISQDKVQVRSMVRSNFLHGKMYHMQKIANSAATVGSSNFTSSGLGASENPNLEINVTIEDDKSRDELVEWFEELWNDEESTKDVKKEVLAALLRLHRPYAPELVYYKTLYELFREEIETRKKTLNDIAAGGGNYYKTQIWNALYEFQQDAVGGILNRLARYNGCILADSVGLGKTYTALAVIKHFELRDKDVLVLCPKKLEENWRTYQTSAGRAGNPLAKDKFAYHLLSHTDLGQTNRNVGDLNLGEIKWGNYGLVVIDESHNFRNDVKGRRKSDKDTGPVKSRYEWLIEKVIQEGADTKVLMLSATPVNTSLIDLRNQINLMTAGKDDAFQSLLRINSVKSFFSIAEKKFKKWEKDNKKKKNKDRAELLEMLGGDIIRLLDGVTIARSRKHIETSYPEFIKIEGKFPARKVENFYPHTDTAGELQYEKLGKDMDALKFYLYRPSRYIQAAKVRAQLVAEKKQHNYNQEDREKFLVDMMRVNFMKRLESSAHALRLTLKRTIDKMDKQNGRIDKFKQLQENSETELIEVDLDDDEFVVNSKAMQPFHLKDLDVKKWQKELASDRAILQNLFDEVAKITPARDNKLHELKKVLRKKSKGTENKKILVFTAFKDTAEYLYEQLGGLAEDGGFAKEIGLPMAMVAGDGTRTQKGTNKFLDVLNNFSPKARKVQTDDEIDLIIATDCVSEGQNLHDCDTVLNYDIHWNPVRLIQRFGRIDRIGSKNPTVMMKNFWPTENIEYYLKLESRVTARMALVDATTTLENSLEDEALREAAQGELDFRNAQMRELQKGKMPDWEGGNTLSMSDLTLEHFIMQLMRYLKNNEEKLRKMPPGVHAVVNAVDANLPRAGAIFVFRHTNPSKNGGHILHPHYVVHVDKKGIFSSFTEAQKTLNALSILCLGKDERLKKLCGIFDAAIKTDMGKALYSKMASEALKDIQKMDAKKGIEGMLMGAVGGEMPKESERPSAENLQLLTWFAIMENQ